MDDILNEKTIKKRHLLLQQYLKNNNVGILNEKDSIIFKNLFSKFYTPDDNEQKIDSKDICCIHIVKNKYNLKCFDIILNNNIRYHTSIKRLSGSSINKNLNIKRALRHEIEYQIFDFINENPLNITLLCPITGYKLGKDSQIDHEIPFHIIASHFLKDNENIEVEYDVENFNYVIKDRKLAEKWKTYHKKIAVLRWLSKDGNKIAHKFYNPNLII
jgi:hypothetical protein